MGWGGKVGATAYPFHSPHPFHFPHHDVQDAVRLGEAIFAQYRSRHRPDTVKVKKMIRHLPQAVGERVQAFFDPEGHGRITRDHIVERCEQAYHDRKNLSLTLADLASLMASLRRFLYAGIAVAVFVIVSLVFSQGAYAEITVTLGTTLLGLRCVWGLFLFLYLQFFCSGVCSPLLLVLDSFAFSQSVSNLFLSFQLLFVRVPYDVGDCVFFNDGTRAYVKQIKLSTTTFRHWNGAGLFIPFSSPLDFARFPKPPLPYFWSQARCLQSATMCSTICASTTGPSRVGSRQRFLCTFPSTHPCGSSSCWRTPSTSSSTRSRTFTTPRPATFSSATLSTSTVSRWAMDGGWGWGGEGHGDWGSQLYFWGLQVVFFVQNRGNWSQSQHLPRRHEVSHCFRNTPECFFLRDLEQTEPRNNNLPFQRCCLASRLLQRSLAWRFCRTRSRSALPLTTS